MMDGIAPAEAQEALDAVRRARQRIADEIGLPRAYWWALAAGWAALGALAGVGRPWLISVASVVFGAAHSAIASRLLDGRRRTPRVQVARAVAGHRTPVIVVGMLLVLVGVTVGLALALDADGAGHPALWAGVVVGAVVGFGGPELLRGLRTALRG